MQFRGFEVSRFRVFEVLFSPHTSSPSASAKAKVRSEGGTPHRVRRSFFSEGGSKLRNNPSGLCISRYSPYSLFLLLAF